MLALNITRIRTAHERFDRVYQPDRFAGNADAFAVVSPVTLGFDIYKDKDRFHLVGRVQTTLELLCSRCLEPFRWPVDAEFDLRYHPQSANTGDGEREVADADLGTAFYEHDEIDLGQLMQEQFYLSLPMKPLCADDCKGLCPSCGTNWNRATCGCANAWDDPRLAALKALNLDSRKGH
jgi:DUF177 domain-containing protein